MAVTFSVPAPFIVQDRIWRQQLPTGGLAEPGSTACDDTLSTVAMPWDEPLARTLRGLTATAGRAWRLSVLHRWQSLAAQRGAPVLYERSRFLHMPEN